MFNALKTIRDLLTSLWRMRPHMRPGRHLTFAVMGSSVLGAVFDGIGVGMLVPLLSILLAGQEATPMRPIRWMQTLFPDRDPAFYVLCFCLVILLAIASKNLFLYLSTLLAGRMKRKLSVHLRDSLYRKFLRSDLSLFEHRTAGEIANVCFGESSRTLVAIEFLTLLGQRATIAFFYFCLLLYISRPLTLFSIVLAALVGSSVGFIYRQNSRQGREITEVNHQIQSCLLDTFGGIRVVRAANTQDHELRRFDQLNLRQAVIEENHNRHGALLGPITEITAITGAMAIVGLSYVFLVRPGHLLPSHLLGFGFILLRLLPMMNQIYGVQGNLLYLAPGVREVETWLNAPEYPVRAFGGAPFEGVQESIRFENLSYVYPNGTRALHDVSFDVPAGSTVALVGPSGSGKSTLATLLMRLRQPTAGSVRVDGRDYWDFSAESWHQGIGSVEQEAFLFHDTLAKNIAYGCQEATQQDIDQAADLAQLRGVIDELPEGLETVVGERGTLLSGGQRQRLAIARALVRNPRILILDEATSALDNIAERQVQAALENAVEGRTVLVIAHRLTTVRNADKIVVLENGTVTEQGRWEDLVSRGGTFEHLLHGSSQGYFPPEKAPPGGGA